MSNGAPPPVPPTPPAAAAKKGLSPLAWVLIGCGGIIVVGTLLFVLTGIFVVKKGKEMVEEATGSDSFEEFMEDMQENPAKVTAETMIRLNPELELVSTDDAAGTLTFRNTQTGEEATLDFEDIAEGRLSVRTDEGEYSLDASGGEEGGVTLKGPEGETRFGASADLSDVPDWVPLVPGAGDAKSVYHSSTGTGSSGAVTFTSSDEAEALIDHYQQVLEDGGYTVRGRSVTTTEDGAFAGISGELSGRTLNVGVVQESGGESQVTINYNETGE